jgi:hypothetical protein
MAATEPRGEQDVRRRIHEERHQLATSVDTLRHELGRATSLGARLDRMLPAAALAALAAGFVLGGGIGATVRLRLRRLREGRVKATAGRFAVVERGR